MKNIIYLRIAAIAAAGIGLMAVVVGSKVLAGTFIPDYHIIPWLVKYNVTMGIISIITGIMLWLNHRLGVKLTAFVGLAHISVLVLLLAFFYGVVAGHSIKAMIFRSVTWVVLFVIVRKKTTHSPNKT